MLHGTILHLYGHRRPCDQNGFSKILVPGSSWHGSLQAIRSEYSDTIRIRQCCDIWNINIWNIISLVSKSYLGWLKALKQDFSYRRNVAIEYCSKYLPECANVKAPIAGMFFATGFDCTKHSEFIAKFESDPLILEAAIFKKPLSTDAQVLV